VITTLPPGTELPEHTHTHAHTVHIWLTDPCTPILAPTPDSFDHLPSTLWRLILQSSDKLFFAHEPVPRGTESVNLLMQNLQNHTVPNTFTFKENAIIWYFSLLLNRAHADDMTKFDNGILIPTECALQLY